MKRIAILALLLSLTVGAMAQDVKFTISSGLSDDGVRYRMERGLSALLSEINRACAQERPLRLDNIDMAAGGKHSLEHLWRNLHFMCDDSEIIERCITTTEGYSVRDIFIQVNPMVENYDEERERSLTVRFTRQGQIASMAMSASDMVYDKIVRQGRDVTDVERRQTILGFVENYRSHYDEKDLNALQQVFSDDALIITGTVIQKKSYEGDQPRLKPEVIYKEQNKTQYLNGLRTVFSRNKHIKVTFSDIEVSRHPTNPDYYGVTLHQHWRSSNGDGSKATYEDDGWVVLIWQFREGQDPIIHRRTWQPTQVGKKRITRADVIDIMDFIIPNKY